MTCSHPALDDFDIARLHDYCDDCIAHAYEATGDSTDRTRDEMIAALRLGA